MARITTIPLFNDKSLSAGDVGTSDVIDLRDVTHVRAFSVSSQVKAGTSTTAGTTVFTYKAAPTEAGVYVAPAGVAAIGTSGNTIGNYFTTFSPILTPFMKIIATQTGAGTAGANSKITAELHVQ